MSPQDVLLALYPSTGRRVVATPVAPPSSPSTNDGRGGNRGRRY